MNNELYHHGVLGMKWGVRRYQNKDGTLTAAGKYRLRKYTSPVRETIKSIPSSFAVKAAYRTGMLLLPGVTLAIAAASDAKYITSNMTDRKDYTQKEGNYEKLSELKKKESTTDVKDDLKKANPRLGKQKGKINNCTYCTVAMEMRARGYDVQARSKGQGAVTKKLYSDMFSNFKMDYSKTERLPKESRKDYINRGYDELCKKIEKNGNGSRGYVGVLFENANMGHAMYWKVENNRVRFYDGQSGKIDPDKQFALADPRYYQYARLDNLKLKEGVTQAVISRKEKRFG